jgi:protein TonB
VAVISNPDWVRVPNGDELQEYYPPRALELSKGGRVSMTCTVTEKGTVTDCAVNSEDPSDMGFGQAALRMKSLFKMRPKTADGQAVGGAKVNIPIRFTPPSG